MDMQTLPPDTATSPPAAAAAKPSRIPIWAWPFAGACILIPLLTLGGAIPAAIGGGSAFACVAVSRKATLGVLARVGICAAITVVAWGIFLMFLLLLVGWMAPGPTAAQP